jgi:predicted house-cleaning NTP pyrophosphatase (Maf/HAM1 superfamily)
VVESRVKMKQLSQAEIDGYLATGDWQGKAGGYSIQGPAGAFIPWISGSHSAIVGLPLAETANLLTAAGSRSGGRMKGRIVFSTRSGPQGRRADGRRAA